MNNKARKIDSVLANELETLPGIQRDDGGPCAAQPAPRAGVGPAERQGVAKHYGVTALTAAQLEQGLPANEVAVLNDQGKLLLKKTPLWYYILREVHGASRGGAAGTGGWDGSSRKRSSRS